MSTFSLGVTKITHVYGTIKFTKDFPALDLIGLSPTTLRCWKQGSSRESLGHPVSKWQKRKLRVSSGSSPGPLLFAKLWQNVDFRIIKLTQVLRVTVSNFIPPSIQEKLLNYELEPLGLALETMLNAFTNWFLLVSL